MIDAGRLFTLAWKVVPRLPGAVGRGLFDLGAIIAHTMRGGPVRQLETNLARVTGITNTRRLRRLSRAGMRSYLRYYCETFQLRKFTAEQLQARVRMVNEQDYPRQLRHSSIVAGLAHLGNWDLAGAWSGRNLAHVSTVAEVLEPESLFREFLSFREEMGMTIVPYRKGTGVFRELVRLTRQRPGLMPLLVDRDLSRDGVVVQLSGHPLRVAPGAAAIAVATGAPFIGIFIRYERLTGQRRRRAGSPWGIVLEFTDPIPPPEAALGNDEAVAAMMQTWADHLAGFLARFPQDWHMLQKCFLADLDLERLARRTHAPGEEPCE